jgi:hypothetical protein
VVGSRLIVGAGDGRVLTWDVGDAKSEVQSVTVSGFDDEFMGQTPRVVGGSDYAVVQGRRVCECLDAATLESRASCARNEDEEFVPGTALAGRDRVFVVAVRNGTPGPGTTVLELPPPPKDGLFGTPPGPVPERRTGHLRLLAFDAKTGKRVRDTELLSSHLAFSATPLVRPVGATEAYVCYEVFFRDRHWLASAPVQSNAPPVCLDKEYSANEVTPTVSTLVGQDRLMRLAADMFNDGSLRYTLTFEVRPCDRLNDVQKIVAGNMWPQRRPAPPDMPGLTLGSDVRRSVYEQGLVFAASGSRYAALIRLQDAPDKPFVPMVYSATLAGDQARGPAAPTNFFSGPLKGDLQSVISTWTVPVVWGDSLVVPLDDGIATVSCYSPSSITYLQRRSHSVATLGIAGKKLLVYRPDEIRCFSRE